MSIPFMAEGYQVIARRWRPKQFDELVGQEHIVRTLKNAIATDRIAHAYLFVGPRGTGKTTTARIFAKALNAEGGPNATPDDSSEVAQAIMDGSCMDVIEIDGASNNSVDDIRSLREECQYSPSQCQFKVYIIDEVHMLSNNAWNALLKTLEEPPPHVKFIFATTEAHKVLPTVVSRCQRFEFRPIPNDKIVTKLSEIASADQIEIDAAALKSVARMADGGMRDAQSILDQLISFCGNNISESDVLDVYGLAAESTLEEFAGALASADYQKLFALIESIAGDGRDLYRVLQDIQSKIRGYLVAAIQNGGQTEVQGSSLTAEALTRMLEALQASESAVRQGLSQRVNFEVALLRAVDQSRTRAIDSVITQLTAIAAGLPEEAGQKKI
ncbi:DNA polymerase III subunit gamma/tau [Rubellicoccus peritrichatus]|uniref:DNA polymerase III subunit gamma/tau n=1 Tax=Rubellicoccus peritrichatus TaxID=3080537 RepID=A0AAQ3L4W9_9BACT|nr:DNA polymerase III subunit gamma/tau [Puniceicoccus sp. CR14]WOO39434.1 DNA polymerase III subunit gamma/tau [Puniceicoccus sp. CR14]